MDVIQCMLRRPRLFLELYLAYNPGEIRAPGITVLRDAYLNGKVHETLSQYRQNWL